MKTKGGFTLVEIVISLAIAALFLPVLARLYTFAIGSSSQGDKYSKAYAFAQEGMEAIYYIKDKRSDIWDWDTLPVNTAVDQYYQIKKISDLWDFDGGIKNESELLEESGYTRSIQIFPEYRDAAGNLGGTTDDPLTRRVVVKVKWLGVNGEEEVTLSSYVTKH
jgi:prepilin-type N-terminal cleavage/methylation domain-containing protein